MKNLFVLFCGLLALSAFHVAHAADHLVLVGGSSDSFSPSTLTINTGDTVTFQIASGNTVGHNVVSDTGLFRCANGCDNDGMGGNGNAASNPWSVTLPFKTAGTFGYYCEPHGSPGAGMHGTIRVIAPAFSITSGITGLWYNSQQSGHGFDLQVFGGGVASAIWYTFDNAGNNLWIVGQGSYSGNKATLNAYTVSGGLFPPAFDSSKIVKPTWGTLTFTFSDCGNGVAAWVPLIPGYVSGSMPITRVGPALVTCP